MKLYADGAAAPTAEESTVSSQKKTAIKTYMKTLVPVEGIEDCDLVALTQAYYDDLGEHYTTDTFVEVCDTIKDEWYPAEEVVEEVEAK